jgi:hypothetical protein
VLRRCSRTGDWVSALLLGFARVRMSEPRAATRAVQPHSSGRHGHSLLEEGFQESGWDRAGELTSLGWCVRAPHTARVSEGAAVPSLQCAWKTGATEKRSAGRAAFACAAARCVRVQWGLGLGDGQPATRLPSHVAPKRQGVSFWASRGDGLRVGHAVAGKVVSAAGRTRCTAQEPVPRDLADMRSRLEGQSSGT